jgi:hypothetical protein
MIATKSLNSSEPNVSDEGANSTPECNAPKTRSARTVSVVTYRVSNTAADISSPKSSSRYGQSRVGGANRKKAVRVGAFSQPSLALKILCNRIKIAREPLNTYIHLHRQPNNRKKFKRKKRNGKSTIRLHERRQIYPIGFPNPEVKLERYDLLSTFSNLNKFVHNLRNK